jgi:hypothetical protein
MKNKLETGGENGNKPLINCINIRFSACPDKDILRGGGI